MKCACAKLPSVAFPALQYFSTLSHEGHDFRGKKLLNIKCRFSLSLRLSETFLFPRKTERDIIKMYSGLQVSIRYSCQVLMTLAISRQIFEKRYNIKFNENQSSGSRVVPCGRVDKET